MRFGLHVSIQGSIVEAPRRAAELGCDCFQVFVGPPRNRRRRMPGRREGDLFRARVKEHGLAPVAVHAGYLVHLISERPRVARASASLFRKEMAIAARLGADYYVVHPGSRQFSGGGRERRAALEEFREAVTLATREAGDGSPTILLENTASRRSGLCSKLEHLGELVRMLEARGGRDARFGACFDTAHAVAAGYDLSTPEGARSTLKTLYRAVGRSRLKLVHANDSRVPRGSGRDIHEHVGRGHVGRRGFGAILSDATMRRLPFILETPVDRPGDDSRNLALTRRIAKRAQVRTPGRSPERRAVKRLG